MENKDKTDGLGVNLDMTKEKWYILGAEKTSIYRDNKLLIK